MHLAPKGAPRNFSAVAVSNTAIEINWTVPIIDDLDGDLTGYLITYYGFVIDTEERTILINTSDTLDQSQLLSPLEDYTFYFISVQAITVAQGPSVSTRHRTLQASKLTLNQPS